MLASAKKLLKVAVVMVDGSDEDDDLSWTIEDDKALVGFSGTLEAWGAWEFKKTLPFSGGFLDQPLAMMIQINALSMVYHTWKAMRDKNTDWSKFSATQMKIIAWLEH